MDRKPVETSTVSEVAESQVISSILKAPEAMDLCAESNLQVSAFGVRLYQRAYKAMLTLYSERRELSLAAVLDEMKADALPNEHDVLTLKGLLHRPVTPGHIKHNIPILIKLSQKRILNKLGQWMAQASVNGREPDAIIDKAQTALFRLGDTGLSQRYRDMKNVMEGVVVSQTTDHGKPVPTGYYDMDEILDGGFWPGELVTLAGETTRGKSCLAGNIALRLGRRGIPCAYLTFEMTGEELGRRMAADQSGVNFRDIRRGRVKGNADYARAVSEIAEMPIYVDDTPVAALSEVLAKIRRLMREREPRLVIVDYLQLMYAAGWKQSRALELGVVTRSLKLTADEYLNTILIISQLNRKTQGDGRYPTLARLRDSGTIEQDSATVIFLHRPEMKPGKPIPSNTVGIVAKQRNGSPGVFHLEFDAAHQRFFEPNLRGEET